MPVEDLSLVDGGLLYGLLRRVGLAGPAGGRALARAAFFAALAWVPLLVLSSLRGQAIGDSLRMPFLLDFSAYTRFLVAVPLLIVAEALVDPWVTLAARQFAKTGLVPDQNLPRFDDAFRRTVRLRDSVPAEIAIIVLAWGGAWLGLHMSPPQGITHWYGTATASGRELSRAGWYYALVSIPIFQLLLYKWGWRLIVWGSFLWSVSRLDLRLLATHPDRAAGLGFLDLVAMRFAMIVLAAFAVLAGVFGNAMYHAGAPLSSFAGIFGLYLAIGLMICVGPHITLVPKLILVRSKGVLDYGALAEDYMQLFHRKWVVSRRGEDDSILGTSDIQSLADIGNASAVVWQTRLMPVRAKTVLMFVAAALLPMVPLVVAEMGVGDAVKILLKFLG